MIKLNEGGIVEMWQDEKSPEVQAISFALMQAVNKIMESAKKTKCFSLIDQLDEETLDYLAVEQRAMYYVQTLPIEKKREIIKNTLKWYQKAGTPAAVEELITTIFGEGKVIEWFDMDLVEEALPGEFDIMTNAPLSVDSIETFKNIINKVKNVRSHLRRIIAHRENYFTVYVANANFAKSNITIRDSGLHIDFNLKRENRMHHYIAGASETHQYIAIRDDGLEVT